MFKGKRVTGIIAGAGKSSRMGFDKLLQKINGVEVARLSVMAMDNCEYIDNLVYIAGDNYEEIKEIFAINPTVKSIIFVKGAGIRSMSVKNGVEAAKDADIIAIHDAARPFVSQNVIKAAIEAAFEYSSAAPAVAVKDTIKQVNNNNIVQTTPKREELKAVQTPQVFDKKLYLCALEKIGSGIENITDDCSVMELAGHKVFLTEGEESNYKITTKEDLAMFSMQGETLKTPRIGHGYDVHKFAEGRQLILGGVDIPYEKGLLGHSDADVLTHAVMDALLGASALGDIGRHFPDTSPEYKGANSIELLKKVNGIVCDAGYRILNIDATILCQKPKLKDYIPLMQENIANALNMCGNKISVKATTEEGLGFTGKGQGIAVHCVVLIE